MQFFNLIIILLSLVGIVFVVGAKIVEIRSGRGGIFSRLSSSADPVFGHYLERIKFFISQIHAENLKRILTILVHNMFHIFGTAGLFVSKHHKNLKSRLNGKRNLNGKGVVSFFLKDVAESKGEEKR